MTSSNETAWMPHQIDPVTKLIDANFPQARDDMGAWKIDKLESMFATVRLPVEKKSIRPGGSVSGPTMFKLVDIAAWIVIISERGPIAIDAVTASTTINFLARPTPADLVCEARLLRLGRRLALSECKVYSDGQEDMVAHATCSYAMPNSAR